MRNLDNSKLMEALSLIDPAIVIPVIERGLEIEKLELIVNKSETTQRRINETQLLLSFLHLQRLGI